MSEEPTYTAPDTTLLGAEHVRRYRETDGAEGYIWNGAKALLLTVTGRKSGDKHTTPLIFEQDGDDFIVIASVGGAPWHPSWYLNLQADNRGLVQVKGDTYEVTARDAQGDERARLWALVNVQWPNYEVYQSRTEREIPVVILTPQQGER